ncbi:MAG: serine/threonine-protein kinase, partial [Gemmataceae bacterium]
MPTSTVNRDQFLARLRESGLLPPDQFAPVYDIAASTDRGRVLARALVERGLLTRFQAEMLLAGRTDGFVLGQYRILDQIGRGGMGRVFKAEHQTMNRVVALKVLSGSLMRTDRAKQLFQREVRAAARLTHPNIVTAYDANQLGDRRYLVMEYVDGPNLQELVQERGPLPVGQACEFVRQAALGLQYAHELGMVHRDIKPANLLVQRVAPSGDCVVKILDFGLARLYAANSDELQNSDSLPAVEAAVMGTPDFLSPEQARDLHGVD